MKNKFVLALSLMAAASAASGQSQPLSLQFDTNKDIAPATISQPAYTKGLSGKALQISNNTLLSFPAEKLPFRPDQDFTIQFWVKSTMDANKTAVLLSQKDFPDNSLASQKLAGWVFYQYGGTWAWNMGSGNRRITHERSNGHIMPLNDGKWHQLTMTYNHVQSTIRLFFDGDNKVLFNVADAVGFNFASKADLRAGWVQQQVNSRPEIEKGAIKLQELLDSFNSFRLPPLTNDDLEMLIVDPSALVSQKSALLKKQMGADSNRLVKPDLSGIQKIRAALGKNPYTVHQISEFMELAPLLKLYGISNGKVFVREEVADTYLAAEKLSRPDFALDKLMVYDRALTPEEINAAYTKYFPSTIKSLPKNKTQLIAADWNIWHGGKHFTPAKDGFDSRVRIAEILRAKDADVIMMQETYSSGDFIAAELGYYYATTVDWDYLNQGANISVLSRYPIEEIYVPKGAPFMNVGAKIDISKGQQVYVMSNWYGMNQFQEVYDFHAQRFAQSDSIPTIFAGDFNNIPHTDSDADDTRASRKMLSSGFTDAYRSLFPDVKTYPGYSHREGVRIDQMYYKGNGVKNTGTSIISTWPSGFPSDHYLMIGTFDL
ncbi:endonuclease/exonuclease/phosphatase family protein [Chitinophaga sp. sic0106]|uniref:endonuclease/exonuclease/phosphatase family protein n=1 Tax=Chitinophaga sp. sic0106 TaxID=2854785 RepID=UPI001C46210B|nr:endonuclease/exonuclease/phosphatase family protein [Chitinophaga sp. sic0106]MBV7529227.1 endonuclease/exonuclease/phosphatase family protein [Chitinophaga sp. sic0106]